MSPLCPADEAELAQIVADHHASRQPLRIRGGGTRTDTGGVSGAVLSMAGMAGIVDYEPGAMTLIARAGTPLDTVRALLAAEGQALAFEPPDLGATLGLGAGGRATLGGVVAANASGPRRLLAGACRDHLLGLRFVDGQGRIARNGGRVMKNVTGLDLGKLMAGAHGTLGVLSEVALKTLPMAPARATLAFHGLEVADAVALFSRALATPYEVTGAAWHARTAWLRIEGLEPQLAYRRDRLCALFAAPDGARIAGDAPEILDDAATVALWRDLADLAHLPKAGPLWRVLVRPSDAPRVVAGLAAYGGQVALDWGGGLIWYAGPVAADALRALAAPGHAKLMRRAGLAGPAFPPRPAGIVAIEDGLRRRFDPAAILNPGLMEG